MNLQDESKTQPLKIVLKNNPNYKAKMAAIFPVETADLVEQLHYAAVKIEEMQLNGYTPIKVMYQDASEKSYDFKLIVVVQDQRVFITDGELREKGK